VALKLSSFRRLEKELAQSRIVGLGSGGTMAEFVRVLAGEEELARRLTVIPSSWQIHLVANEHGLKVAPSTFMSEVDLTVDGADQVDGRRRIIKGGGGALLKEKLLWEAAKSVFVIAREDKFVRDLERPVPVEVVPAAVNHVSRRVKGLGGEPALRTLEKGYPFVTENGNMILDVGFAAIEDAEELERRIKQMVGVVEVGLFNFPDVTIYKIRGQKVEEL
jgi:ribose 5-phosphate isomerase A